ncbi:hypothetical protein DRH13_05930 [Candidatus Woesebacteria bacterium]|nr:MAG: hypothetical protein DRH13_05930 [Candidatus Woesebacteria bacterium]
MIKNEKLRNWVNRIFAFLVGGLLIFLIMNFAVVSSVKNQNEELKKELEESQYGAKRLLDNAKAYFEDKEYVKAIETLDTLFEKQPGSNETAEGKKMYTEVQDKIKKEQKKQEEVDRKWETAVGAIQEKWQEEKAAQLREQLEKEMNDTLLDKEWEKAKEEVREKWEEQ